MKIDVNEKSLSEALSFFNLDPKQFLIKGEKVEKSNPFNKVPQVKEDLGAFKAEIKKGLEIESKKNNAIEGSVSKLYELQKAISLKQDTLLTEIKSLVKKNKEQEDIIKSLKKDNETLSASFIKETELIKGQLTQLEGIDSRIKTIENTPMPKKSITSNFVERGFEGDGIQKGETFSASRNKAEITLLLESKAQMDLIEKGIKNKDPKIEFWRNELIGWEASKTLSKGALIDLNKEGVKIVA